jgi:cysteinyl-tRNA synthetase
MLQLSGEKMSKSIGNLVTIEEFLSEHDADVLRMMILNSSYRGPLTFNDDVIAQAERGLDRLHSALRPALPAADGPPAEVIASLKAQTESTQQGFRQAMDDDFNTASALGMIYDLVRAINQARDAGADDASLGEAQSRLRELTGILGLQLTRAAAAGGQADEFVELLIEVRKQLREQKLWALSDLIRDRLSELGVVLEDVKEGSTWRWK